MYYSSSALFKRLLLLLALGRSGSGGGGGRSSSILLLVERRIAPRVLKHVCQVALAAVVTVEMHGHEGAGTALLGALLPQASDLARGLIHLVVLEHSELDLLVLALDLLRLGVHLLLTLLASADKLKVAAGHDGQISSVCIKGSGR